MDGRSGRGLAWVGELVVFGVGCGHGTEGCGGGFGDGDLERDERDELRGRRGTRGA